jgi:hypothetical protein
MPAHRLGQFYEGLASWRRALSRTTPEAQPVVFSNAVAEVAGYVRKGLDRIVAIDELADMAASIGWADVDRAQAIIAETFKKINGNGVAEVVPEDWSDLDLNRDQRIDNETSAAVSLDDFLAYMPQHNYIFTAAGETWPAASVNARVQPVMGPDGKSMPAAKWLDANAAVEQMTWAPGKPMLIPDKLIADGGWIDRPGCAVFNLYRPPAIVPVAGDVAPWLSLVEKVFPDQAKHVVSWLAHRVQRPDEKINHALVLGGEPGIGKDTILEPVKQAIGPWNFADVSPKQALGRFNGFLKSVVLRISEARDLGEFDRFAFHDHMKAYIAAPPDVVRVDEKNLKEHYILNLCGVVITTNHKTNGIYLPADDRRHLVAWSSLTKNDFDSDYWRSLYRWYAEGGNQYVADYLKNFDISAFDPKEPPPKTQAFWEIVNANRAPEDSELADVLDSLGRPDVVTLAAVVSRAASIQPVFYDWLNDRRNRRSIPHRFEDCGYVAVSNPNDTEGRWKISGHRQTIYGKANHTERERHAAAFKFTGAR